MKKTKDFIRVGNQYSNWYGGAQDWCQQKYMRQYGCGVIACANLLFHLLQKEDRNSGYVDKTVFMKLVEELRRKYLLVLPILGMNGIMMMLGMNWYFFRHKMSYRARWGCLPSNLWERTREMLNKGIPVVVSVGPNFPKMWGKNRVKLYMKYGSVYQEKTQTKAHYVTITDMDEEWLTVSSWGNKYYINKREYEEYVKKYSNYLFSNILYVV